MCMRVMGVRTRRESNPFESNLSLILFLETYNIFRYILWHFIFLQNQSSPLRTHVS